MRNHPDVRAAQYALRAARETALQVRGQFLPQVTGNVSATREQITAASGGTTGAPTLYNLYETTVDVSYTLDLFGGIRRQVESAMRRRSISASRWKRPISPSSPM